MAYKYIGSARIGSNGSITNDSSGDGKQSGKPDYSGEVSMQRFYQHAKGWRVLRVSSNFRATLLAEAMERACNNKNIGYDQNGRYGILKAEGGTRTEKKTECDCSSLVRQCLIEATGKDPGDFNTGTEEATLRKFFGTRMKAFDYVAGKTDLQMGDILVTKTKGHTAVVVKGTPRMLYKLMTKNSQLLYKLPTFDRPTNETVGSQSLLYVAQKVTNDNGKTWYKIRKTKKNGQPTDESFYIPNKDFKENCKIIDDWK